MRVEFALCIPIRMRVARLRLAVTTAALPDFAVLWAGRNSCFNTGWLWTRLPRNLCVLNPYLPLLNSEKCFTYSGHSQAMLRRAKCMCSCVPCCVISSCMGLFVSASSASSASTLSFDGWSTLWKTKNHLSCGRACSLCLSLFARFLESLALLAVFLDVSYMNVFCK